MTPHPAPPHEPVARPLLEESPRDESGDVPGWVMITVMSAGIVALLTAFAGPTLGNMLEAALTSVGGG